jgi:3-deoxy-D-manno-octulosonate 8-phosphate phosphatase (KDO 8-P phosphatase)
MESQQSLGSAEDSGLPQLGSAGQTLELVNLFDKIARVRAFLFDVDGVLTDNNVLVTEAGELLRTMNVRDGQAIKWAIRAGYPIAVITGGRSEGVRRRLLDLGVEEYHPGIHDKYEVFTAFLQRAGLDVSDVCYMGDDLPDLPVLRRVLFAACPFDAVPEVLASVDYVSPRHGGSGCARDVIEKVMKAQGTWPKY